MGRRNQTDGQASAELIAVVAAMLVAALLLAQVVVAAWTLLSAGEAARAGARASYLGADPVEAARRAVPRTLGRPGVSQVMGRVRVSLAAPSLFPGMPRIPIDAAASLDPLVPGP